MNKLEVGQVLYRKTKKSMYEHTITKVGNKYFEVTGFYRTKFYIEGLIEKSEYGGKIRLHLNKESIKNTEEITELNSKFRLFFGGYGKTTLNLKQLRSINKIIEDE